MSFLSFYVVRYQALMNLGYLDGVAKGALGTVKKQLGEEEFNNLKVEVLIREALRALA